MSLIQAYKFVKALNQLLFQYEVIGRTFGFMIAFTALYAALCYFMSSTPDTKVGLCILVLFLYQAFRMEWLNYRLRCPQCGGRFFMPLSPIGPVNDGESCRKCGVTIREIEETAREKVERVKRG